jgi:hypothetical protein
VTVHSRRSAVARKLFSKTYFLCFAGFLGATLLMVGVVRLTKAQETDDNPSVSTNSPLLTVLNPAVENKMAERLPLSPRLKTLEGKKIYMVDINWGGPEASLNVFEEIQDWFGKNMPSVKTVIKIKRGGYDADDPALWKEISDNHGDGVIVGVSA